MTDIQDAKKPVITFYFDGIEEPTQVSLKKLVNKNFEIKMDMFLNYIYTHHPDGKVLLDVRLSKNKHGTFDGSFSFVYPLSEIPLTYTREGFHDLLDLVNHAFKNFKERLSDETGVTTDYHASKIKQLSDSYGKDEY